MKISVVNMEPEKKRSWGIGLGMVLIIIGFILLFNYIIHFIKIFIGIILIGVGYYLIADEKFFRRWRFFRF
jgi:uncharacterized membrane protein HdeD (DUF308 family)